MVLTDSAGRRVIRFGPEEGRVVRLVGRMPFVSSREVADLLDLGGYVPGRKMMDNLAALGHVTSINTAGVQRNGWEVKRFVLTSKGIRRLAALEGISIAEAMRRFPVALQWRRSLLRRLESLEMFYKICVFVAAAYREEKLVADKGLARGPVFHWRRDGWLGGTVGLGWGKHPPGIRVMRLGSSALRRAILHRLGSMMRSWLAEGVECVLVVVPGHTELRFVEGWLRRNAWAVQAYCIVESDLREAAQWSEVRLLRPVRYGSLSYGVDVAFGNLERRRNAESRRLDGSEPYSRPLLPGVRMLRNGRHDREIMLSASLSRLDRSTLQVVFDWPLGLRSHLLGMAGLTKRSLTKLVDMGYVYYVWDGGHARCLLTEMGLRYLASRDRSSVGALRDRWGYAFVHRGDAVPNDLRVFPVSGYRVADGARLRAEGGKLRSMSRQLEHLDGITGFLSLCGEGRKGFDLLEALPTHRSERWAGTGKQKRAILPDASFIASVNGETLPFVLEFERRADRPAKVEERLMPYKNYYDSMFSYEDIGRILVTLVLFDSKVNASGFTSYCFSGRDAARTKDGRLLPLYVSSVETIDERGCWADVWLAVGGRFGGRYMSLTELV